MNCIVRSGYIAAKIFVISNRIPNCGNYPQATSDRAPKVFAKESASTFIRHEKIIGYTVDQLGSSVLCTTYRRR